ncbi:hypothetical protein J6590_085327 [Homalodisca vitripennis]|nr:hypothetical protein J6590_085327 [Homalodisca vitripennis]
MQDITTLKDYIPKVFWESFYGKLSEGRRPQGELDEEPEEIVENEEEQSSGPVAVLLGRFKKALTEDGAGAGPALTRLGCKILQIDEKTHNEDCVTMQR